MSASATVMRESWITDPRTLWGLIEARADATPMARMLIDEDAREMTFVEYRAECERVAAGFQELGVTEGTAVSWQLPTWIESVVLVGALSRLGAVQNPILPIYRAREVGFVARQTGARFLLVPGEWRGFDYEGMALSIAKDNPGLEVLVVNRGLPQDDPDDLPPYANDPDALRWVFYTSGTTADPKGAKHTDPSVWASAYAMVLAFELAPEDRHGLVFPFTHIGGLGLLIAALISGCSHAIVEAFVPATTIPVLTREDVTIAGAGTPFHLAYLDAQRALPSGQRLFPSARAFVGGGSAKPPQLHYDVKAELGGVGIVSGYGLTECPILSMGSIHDTDEQLANTEGRATPGVEIKVVKLDGTVGKAGEEGELCVKGPQLCLGYLDSSLDGPAFDDAGFFRSGDLGVLDADGYVTITGRVKDVIIRKGENISAKEVEDLLFTHPKIADAAVIGLPDPRSGERAAAIVVPKDPADAPTLAELSEFCKAENLMVQKIPEQLEIVDVLPRNPTGKVLKHELRAQYAGLVLPDELKAVAARVSNWGRWGGDDERGTLNLIDAAAVLRGVASVRRGAAFSLSIPMHVSGPQTDGPGAPGRLNPTLKMKYVNVSFTGDPDDFTTTDDLLELSLQAATHIDALSHAGYEGLLYNNVRATEITPEGAAKLGIEKVGPIVTRGILLDIARSTGVDRLAAGTVIGAPELDTAVGATGVTIEPGDAVLVRTGQMELLAEERRDDYRIQAPGFGVSAVEWFHDHDLSMVANDTYAFEIYPPEHPTAMMAVHMLDLRDVGLTQGQLWFLDDLAADCAAEGVWEFLLSATPLPVVGAVSGLVAPVAVK